MNFSFLLYCLAVLAILAVLFGVLLCNKRIIKSKLENITISWFKFCFASATADWWLILICWAVLGLNKFFPWIKSILSWILSILS